MAGGKPYGSESWWSWRRFFVSLGIAAVFMSVGLWWYSGRFPLTPEEVRFRILMVQYAQTRYQLDRISMAGGSQDANRYNATMKISNLCKSFESFLNRYPEHDQAMNVYGSFLDEFGKGEDAVKWWQRATEFSRKNPQLLNNLANYYGHNGHAEEAIKLYEEAIRLDPTEPVFHFNLANMYYLFRKETHSIHGWSLQQTFENSLGHFKRARELAPRNVEYAISYAETYYGVKFLSPNFEWNDAETAWKHCLSLNDRPEFQDAIRVHLVRVNAYQGESAEAFEWYNQLESNSSRQLAWQILRRFFPDEVGTDA